MQIRSQPSNSPGELCNNPLRSTAYELRYTVYVLRSTFYDLRYKVYGKWGVPYTIYYMYMLIVLAWPSVCVAGNLLLFLLSALTLLI